jgi:hypothetical protein
MLRKFSFLRAMVDQVQCTEGTNPAKAGSCTNVELLHLRLILYDDTKFYTVDFTLKDVNKDGDFTDGDVFCTGSGANERCIAEQKTVSVYDAGGTQVFHGNLQSSTADGILKQDDEASPQDILDSGIYQSTTGDDAALDALKLEDSTWITSGMSGRVVVEVAGDEGGG